MIDYFALLDVERRPAITEETLKNAYFRKSESLRLDQAEPEAFSSVNVAFRILCESCDTNSTFVKLEFGDARGGQIASDLGELFGNVVEALQSARPGVWITLSQKVQPFFAPWRSREWTDFAKS